MEHPSCRLLHHGTGASSGGNHIAWIKQTSSSILVYSSHAILNLATARRVQLANGVQEDIWNVTETLRTNSLSTWSSTRVITCICSCKGLSKVALIAAFSDGSIVLWTTQQNDMAAGWKEIAVLDKSSQPSHSVTVVSAQITDEHQFLIVAGSSANAVMYHVVLSGEKASVSSYNVLEHAVNSVRLEQDNNMGYVIIIGSAAPKHNKIHAYTVSINSGNLQLVHHGALTGHEDWITDFDWWKATFSLLASASQDGRIRLWRFTTSTARLESQPELQETEEDDDSDGFDEHDAEEADEAGESRMTIYSASQQSETNVTLEALLIGHEASVTSVCWHPCPQKVYGQNILLISSSMDRTILLWGPAEDGIWTPLTRMGSAGGILGGSIGSSLLGYCRASLEPMRGGTLVGHAYGGAMHFWNVDVSSLRATDEGELSEMTVEDRAALIKWRAAPCITGHFNGVTDLSWEPSSGAYVLTVSRDQTCRLWSEVQVADSRGKIWIELARPQVHGYDLAAVASLSTPDHPHLLVTGADEKELRVFDAPKTTLRTLKAVSGKEVSGQNVERVGRAYIPALGLSNKASANDGAEEDKAVGDVEARSMESDAVEKMRLPLERDLGAVSLWPEIAKLFGHNSELYCLAATVDAWAAGSMYSPPSDVIVFRDVLLASSTKARDVDNAVIRLWDVEEGKCRQILAGGHKSTVASMSFSPNGQYLASSGKDRRLCIWKRSEASSDFKLAWAKDSAHKRIVWSVHFCSYDDSILASGSRDGCVKIWKVTENQSEGGLQQLSATEMFSFAPNFHRDQKPDAVTSLSFAPIPLENGKLALLALGLESGHIELWKIPHSATESATPQLLHAFTSSLCPIATITKLAWRPIHEDHPQDSLTLASSSMDHGCRIFQVEI